MIRVHSRYANHHYNPPLELDIIEYAELPVDSRVRIAELIVKDVPTVYIRKDNIPLTLQRIIIEELPDGEQEA